MGASGPGKGEVKVIIGKNCHRIVASRIGTTDKALAVIFDYESLHVPSSGIEKAKGSHRELERGGQEASNQFSLGI